MTTCDTCGEEHLDTHGRPGCPGHVKFDRDSYVPGQPRVPLDKPRPCRRTIGDSTVCHVHGGGAKHIASAKAKRKTAKQIKADADRLLAHRGRGTIADPLAAMHHATQALEALSEALGAHVNSLDSLTVYDSRGAAQLAPTAEHYIQTLRDRLRFNETLLKHTDNSAREMNAVDAFIAKMLGHDGGKIDINQLPDDSES